MHAFGVFTGSDGSPVWIFRIYCLPTKSVAMPNPAEVAQESAGYGY
jgi:hypothetical protein